MEQPFALILASASPRRRELLSRMGYAFEVCAPDVDEHVEGRAEDIVKTLAVRKARAAASHYARGVIIASDTLVSLEGRPLGKPADENEAHAMLRALSGRAHDVFTGVCLRDAATGHEMVEEVKTAVRFRELTDERSGIIYAPASRWTRPAPMAYRAARVRSSRGWTVPLKT